MGREVSGVRLLGASLEAYERSEDPLFALEPLGQMIQSLHKSTAVIILTGILHSNFGVKPIPKIPCICATRARYECLRNNKSIDAQYYIDHQLQLPLLRIFGPIMGSSVANLVEAMDFLPMAESPGDDKKAQSLLFCGQHTRKLHTPTPQGPFWATGRG